MERNDLEEVHSHSLEELLTSATVQKVKIALVCGACTKVMEAWRTLKRLVIAVAIIEGGMW